MGLFVRLELSRCTNVWNFTSIGMVLLSFSCFGCCDVFPEFSLKAKFSDLEFLLARISLLSKVGSMSHKIATS